jgi:hypothetical protein
LGSSLLRIEASEWKTSDSMRGVQDGPGSNAKKKGRAFEPGQMKDQTFRERRQVATGGNRPGSLQAFGLFPTRIQRCQSKIGVSQGKSVQGPRKRRHAAATAAGSAMSA